MRRTSAYLPSDSIFPFRGLDTLAPSSQLLAGYSPSMRNVEVDRGIVHKRTGYRPIAGMVDGRVLAIIPFEDLDGTDHLVLITSTKQYLYDIGADAWTNITYQSGGVDVDWTGGPEDLVNWAVVTGKNGSNVYSRWLVVTNGHNKPRYWDGSMARFGLYEPNIPDFVTCKTIALFYDHVILGNITSTSEEEQLVIWSDTQKLLEFQTANSGSALLTQSRGAIQRFMPLGDRMVVYSANSISTITYVGGTVIYAFDQITEETRLASPNSIVNIGPFHAYAALDNFYVFDGTRVVTRAGDKVKRSYNAALRKSEAYRVIGFHDSVAQKIYFTVPVTADTVRTYQVEYDLDNMADAVWTELVHANRVEAYSLFSQPTDMLWSSAFLNIPWSQAAFPWESQEGKQGNEAVLVGSQGNVFRFEGTAVDDAGVAIESWWDSLDFTVPEYFKSEHGRWIEAELDLSGASVDVMYSVDEGISYTLLESLTLGSDWKKFKIPFDVMSPTFRIRLYNKSRDVGFALRWLRIWVRPGGANG